MKTNVKRKNYYLDEKKIRRVRTILGAKTETEAIDTAFKPSRFQKRNSQVIAKNSWQGWAGKRFFSGQAPDRHGSIRRSYPKRNNLSFDP
jgi:hypothetical protein